jgi:hypothetical protein
MTAIASEPTFKFNSLMEAMEIVAVIFLPPPISIITIPLTAPSLISTILPGN